MHVNQRRVDLRSVSPKLYFVSRGAADDRIGTLARFPMRFAVAAFSFLHAI
jgi:hypothetical protein